MLAIASRQQRPPHTPSLFQYSRHCTACSSCALLSSCLVSSLRARLHGSNRCPLPGAILAGAALLATPATVQNRCNWALWHRSGWHRCIRHRYSMKTMMNFSLLPAEYRWLNHVAPMLLAPLFGVPCGLYRLHHCVMHHAVSDPFSK